MSCYQPELTGSLLVAVQPKSVELTVSIPRWNNDRVYAYDAGEAIDGFMKQLLLDLSSGSREEESSTTAVAELLTTTGASVSPSTAHKHAWKTRRRLVVSGITFSLQVVELDEQQSSKEPSPPGTPPGTTRKVTQMKYLVVTGGVVSGLGKGVTASSLGVLIKCAGYRVTSIKIDPYLNVDAGTMSPFEHGEVFTLDDGGEADLDLGNYERFTGTTLTRDNNITTGKIYQSCLERERRGDYLGKTVQVVPHVTNCIMEWIERVAHVPVDGQDGHADFCIIELGGTVGDIESMPFVEALRQFQFRVGRDNLLFFHVSLVPVLGSVGEEKTKPTQHSVQQLRAVGLTPDFLVCRSSQPLEDSTKAKLALFCHVPEEHCIGVHDVSNIYHVPLLLERQNVVDNIFERLHLTKQPDQDLTIQWRALAELVDSLKIEVTIAVVGKYTHLSDAYLSVTKALQHASYAVRRKIVIKWVEAENLEPGSSAYAEAWAMVKAADGILVPGGFGDRGVEGKILAAKYARESKKPYLGICLGFQVGVVEFARSMLGLTEAHSAEFNSSSPHQLIVFMPEVSRTHMGGTMRLGSRTTVLGRLDCKSAKLYGDVDRFDERHRHRYEVNIEYVERMEAQGLEFVGRDTTGERMEVFELKNHPYYVGCQFHPEFKSRPTKPSPLFLGLLKHAAGLPGAP